MTRLNYCYDCRKAHWAADCPKRNPPKTVTQSVTLPPVQTVMQRNGNTMPSSEKLNETWKKRRHCPTCRCHPMTNAERQRVYRARHKAANGS